MPVDFWWNWWVSLAAAVGTLMAVIVALFGQSFRAKFFPPILNLKLNDLDGEPARAGLKSPTGPPRMESARYWHLRLSNTRRWSPATQVQILLLQVEKLADATSPYSVWRGNSVPIKWQHQEIHPILRTIGDVATADLCSVVKDKWLEIHPLVTPYALTSRYESACVLVLTVQARAAESDSATLRIRIEWDGSWHDGAQEMRNHLRLAVEAANYDSAG